jgi:hypothetical protein
MKEARGAKWRLLLRDTSQNSQKMETNPDIFNRYPAFKQLSKKKKCQNPDCPSPENPLEYFLRLCEVVKSEDVDDDYLKSVKEQCESCYSVMLWPAADLVLSKEDMELKRFDIQRKPEDFKNLKITDLGFQFSSADYEIANGVKFCQCLCHTSTDPCPSYEEGHHAALFCDCKDCFRERQRSELKDMIEFGQNPYKSIDEPITKTPYVLHCSKCNEADHSTSFWPIKKTLLATYEQTTAACSSDSTIKLVKTSQAATSDPSQIDAACSRD